MASIEVISPEEFAAFRQELKALRTEVRVLRTYVITDEEWLPKEQAIPKAGLKTRDSLEKYARASGPNKKEPGRITWRKVGKKCLYLRSSCFDYAQRKLGQPPLVAQD
jgi:hypothetical protein